MLSKIKLIYGMLNIIEFNLNKTKLNLNKIN